MNEPVTVGCPPYLSVIPLVMKFEEWGDRTPVRVVFDEPARLPALLESGAVQAILAPSVDALRVPGRRMAMAGCIGSHGPFMSAKVLTKVPPTEIRVLALDANSMTANRAAQIILMERYRSDPKTITMTPDVNAMLAEADACVLIGDVALQIDRKDLHVLDLGEEWKRLTRKPFVWAAWIGNESLTPELAMTLEVGSVASIVSRPFLADGWRGRLIDRWLSKQMKSPEADKMIDDVRRRLVERVRRQTSWTDDQILDYFLNVVAYDLNDTMLNGLREFQRRLLQNGFSDASHFPALIAPEIPGIDALRQMIVDSGAEIPDWLLPSR